MLKQNQFLYKIFKKYVVIFPGIWCSTSDSVADTWASYIYGTSCWRRACAIAHLCVSSRQVLDHWVAWQRVPLGAHQGHELECALLHALAPWRCCCCCRGHHASSCESPRLPSSHTMAFS